MRAATLSIFRHLYASVAEEMGVTLGRTACSPNIKERLDFSCAVFLPDGRLLAQAAHIPVHLGSMPASVQAAITHGSPFTADDLVILNDPYLGGTHLPDITLVSPVFVDEVSNLSQGTIEELAAVSEHKSSVIEGPHFFVASRAHHADVGGSTPGSMPISREIYQEGMIIPPLKLSVGGMLNKALWQLIVANVRTPWERECDLAAQIAAHQTGQKRLLQIVRRYGLEECYRQAEELISYTASLTRAAIQLMPDGQYSFRDFLDDDGQGAVDLPINVTISISGEELVADFRGSSPAVPGNLNAVPAIVDSSVAYVVRCLALQLLNSDIPMNQGAFEPASIIIESGSILDPPPARAVAAGNVETSQRLVDVLFGALAQALPDIVPAASQGTMNNLTFGSRSPRATAGGALTANADIGSVEIANPFAYYETHGGGIGAGPSADGGHGLHAHMSNTRNTPVEAMEYSMPVRVVEYALRQGSGGQGLHHGGEGQIRTLEFLTPATVTLVSERRKRAPYGLQGGEPGSPGCNSLIRDNLRTVLDGKVSVDLEPGDKLCIETPGGGGWGTTRS